MDKTSAAIIRQVKAGKNIDKALSKAKKLTDKDPEGHPNLVALLKEYEGTIKVGPTKEEPAQLDEVIDRVEFLEKENSEIKERLSKLENNSKNKTK